MADATGADVGTPVQGQPDNKVTDVSGAGEAAEAVLLNIRRDINCLGDGSKMARKRAINTIRAATVDDDKVAPPVLTILLDTMLKPLLKLFVDKVEKVRELAIELLIDFVKRVTTIEPSLPYMVPAMESRMGQLEIEEPSEEVRLLHINLCAAIINKAGSGIGAYLDDIVRILSRTVTDPYPNVMKDSCDCVVSLAAAAPERFYSGTKPLARPLLKTLGHQHSRVRVQAVHAVEALCMAGDKEALSEFMVTLAQKTMDHAPTVRRALYTAVGHWMLELPDRYSYWSRLLTLMLNGMCDEVPEIQALCKEKFHAAGKQWEEENHDEIKDLLDFGTNDNDTNPGRPPLGCRLLVDRECGKILPGLLKDIFDWTAAIRLQSANLLLVLLMYTEGQVTIHLEKVLSALFKAVRDEDVAVGKKALQSAEVLGRHTKPPAWADIVLPRLSTPGLAISDQIGMLIVTGGLLRGCAPGTAEPTLEALANVLASDAVSNVHNEEMVEEIFLLVKDVLTAAEPTVADSLGYPLFTTLINARSNIPSAEEHFHEVVTMLAERQGVDLPGLYRKHTPTLLAKLHTTHKDWTKHSFERAAFSTVLSHGGPALGDNVDVIMDIFCCNFQPDKDPELRLLFFSLLAKLITSSKDSLNASGKFTYADQVVTKIVLPNVVWENGRVPSAIRTAACMCLWALFQAGFMTPEVVDAVVAPLLPRLVSLLDDDSEDTRLITCRVVEQLLLTHCHKFVADFAGYDQLHSLYPELLKRLDDNSDPIRLASLKAWQAYAECMAAKPYDDGLYQAHADTVLRGLFIHLDDPDEQVQDAVAAVLKTMAKAVPEMVRAHARESKGRHRSPKRCEDVEAACGS
eukprot:m.96210 g.96210  ORF g.96210 m.96210 type:complete len:856 (-) comp10150_c0_seq2:11-2578(-)